MTQHPSHGYWLVGRNRVEIIAESETNDGVVLTRVFGNAGDGAPLHAHPDVETFVVTKGRLRFITDGVISECGPQESVTIASGLPHTYAVLEAGSEWLLLLSGSAFDRFVAEVGVPVEDPSDPSEGAGPAAAARMAEAGGRYGVTVLGPPPPELRQDLEDM